MKSRLTMQRQSKTRIEGIPIYTKKKLVYSLSNMFKAPYFIYIYLLLMLVYFEGVPEFLT